MNSSTAAEDGSTISDEILNSASVSHVETANETLPQPTSAKRARGRPPKSSLQKQLLESSLMSEESTENKQTESDSSVGITSTSGKKRGRKPKENSESRSSSVNSFTAAEDASTVTGDGMTSTSVSNSEAATESSSPKTVIKRSRGRPSLQRQVLESSLISDEITTGKPTEGDSVEVSVAAVSSGKKRGSKQKENNEIQSSSFTAVEDGKTFSADDITSASVPPFEAGDETLSPSTTAKRSRGRPPKGSIQKQVLESNLITNESTKNHPIESDSVEAGATLSSGKKRGRKPKEINESQNASLLEENGTADSLTSSNVSNVDSAENLSQSTAAKRPRGRPPSVQKQVSDSNLMSSHDSRENKPAESNLIEGHITLSAGKKRGRRPKALVEAEGLSPAGQISIEKTETVPSETVPMELDGQGSIPDAELAANQLSNKHVQPESNPALPVSETKKRGRKPKAVVEAAAENQDVKDHPRIPTPTSGQGSVENQSGSADSISDTSFDPSTTTANPEERETLVPEVVSKSADQVETLKPEPKKRGRPSLASKQESSIDQVQAQLAPGSSLSQRQGKQRLLVKHIIRESLLTPDNIGSLTSTDQKVKKKVRKSGSVLGRASLNLETLNLTPDLSLNPKPNSAQEIHSSANQIDKSVETEENIYASVTQNEEKTQLEEDSTSNRSFSEDNSHHTDESEIEMEDEEEEEEIAAPTTASNLATASTADNDKAKLLSKFQPVIKSAEIFKVPSPKVDLKSAAEILSRLIPGHVEKSQLKKGWGRRSTLLKQDNIGESLSIGETTADSDEQDLSENKKDVIVFNSVLEPIIDPIHSAPNAATNPVDPIDSLSTPDMTEKADDINPGNPIHPNFSKRASSLDTHPGAIHSNKKKRGKKPMLLKQTKIEKSISFQDVLSEPHLDIKDDEKKTPEDIIKSPEAQLVNEIAPIQVQVYRSSNTLGSEYQGAYSQNYRKSSLKCYIYS